MKVLTFYLLRNYLKEKYTIGNLYYTGIELNGKTTKIIEEDFLCNIIEDKFRGNDLAKKKVLGETCIPEGNYQIRMTYSPKYKKSLPQLLNVPYFEGIRIHCLDEQTEILTINGWKNIENYNNEDLITYNRETKEYEVLPNKQIIKYHVEDEDMYFAHNNNIDYCVTNKHNLWVGSLKHDKTLKWQTKTADSLLDKEYIKVSGKNEKEPLNEKFLVLYKLAMATIADGYYRKYNQSTLNVCFHFKKQRKIDKIIYFLNKLDEPFSSHVNEDGTTVISLNKQLSLTIAELLDEPTTDYKNYKLIPNHFYDLSSTDLQELLKTYLFFDGKYENFLKNNCSIITASHKQRIDQLQALAVLAGYGTYLYKSRDAKELWELRYSKKENVPIDKKNRYVDKYTGYVWCVSNDNETIIIRRNGRTCIVQNCGNSAQDSEGCLIPGMNKEVGKVLESKKHTDEIIKKIKKYDIINIIIKNNI